jgi:mono/diheme cytochrome c family protein
MRIEMKSFALSLAAATSFLILPIAAASADAESADAAQAVREKGRALFQGTGCFQCHTLAHADANGAYAPSLDNNANLNRAFVIATLTSGRGDMPSFGGLLSEDEMALLADYLVQEGKKDGAP